MCDAELECLYLFFQFESFRLLMKDLSIGMEITSSTSSESLTHATKIWSNSFCLFAAKNIMLIYTDHHFYALRFLYYIEIIVRIYADCLCFKFIASYKHKFSHNLDEFWVDV